MPVGVTACGPQINRFVSAVIMRNYYFRILGNAIVVGVFLEGTIYYAFVELTYDNRLVQTISKTVDAPSTHPPTHPPTHALAPETIAYLYTLSSRREYNMSSCCGAKRTHQTRGNCEQKKSQGCARAQQGARHQGPNGPIGARRQNHRQNDSVLSGIGLVLGAPQMAIGGAGSADPAGPAAAIP